MTRALTILMLLLAASMWFATPTYAGKRVMGLAVGGRSHTYVHRHRHVRRPGGFSGASSAAGVARNLGY